MKTLSMWLTIGLVTMGTAFGQELSWQELVRRPEMWPTQCTINRSIKFQSGASVSAGQKLDVLEIQPNQIGLGTTDGHLSFAAKPDDTDALALARAVWAKLTPAQRDLTYATLLHRTDLWPYRVALRVPIELNGNRKLTKGEKVVLQGVEGNQILVLSEAINTSFDVDPSQTDLLEQARRWVSEKNGAPSRVAEELAGKLIDPATGKSATLDTNAPARIYAFYRGAGWCGPCREFSPTLLKTYKDLKSKYSGFELVFLSADHSPTEMQRYVQDEGFPWLAVSAERVKELTLLSQNFGQYIPQLVIVDSHGKLLVDSEKGERSQALKQFAELVAKNP